MMMRTEILSRQWLVPALALMLLGSPVTRAAVSWSAGEGATRVLLVTADDATQVELTRVAEILQRYYGASPDTARLLFGAGANTEAIENALIEMSGRTSPRDTLVVVLGLPLHNQGRDRVLVTHGFNPEQPWTGLSLDLLEKLASGGVAGTYWQFAPSCSLPTKGSFQQYEQKSNAYLGESGGGVALVTFCERGGQGHGRDFAQALAQTLNAVASDRLGSGSSGGVVILEEVLGRLSKTAHDVEVRSERVAARGATLRVRAASNEPVAAQLHAALVSAPTDVEAIAVLDRAVEQGRSTKDVGKSAEVANALADYAIKDSADVNRRARAVQAMGSLPAAAASPALDRVFRSANEGRLRASALREWQRIAAPGDVSLINAGLGDTDPVVQIAALLEAGNAADKGATDAVIKALKTASDRQVRMAAARALVAVAEPVTAEAELLEALRDPDEQVRAEAANSLGQLKLSAAVAPTLLAAANADSSMLVREKSVYALGAAWPQLSETERLDIEGQLLDIAVSGGQSEGVRIAAIYTIARGGSVSRGDRIISIARRESESPALRKTAVEALGELRLTRAISALTDIAQDVEERAELRVAAAASLGKIPDGAAADTLWDLTASDSVDVAAVARRALDQGATYSPAAAAAIGDETLTVERRAAAAKALGNAPTQHAFDLLVTALADRNRELREAAILSLSRFTQSPYPESMAKVLSVDCDNCADKQRGVAFALAVMNSDAARGILAAHAGASDVEVRLAVANGLGTSRSTEEGFVMLTKLASDRSKRVRAATAISLSRIENFKVTNVLEPMTKDEDPDVRAAAVESMRAVLARGTPAQRS